MEGLRLFTSCHLEPLVAHLDRRLRTDPLEPWRDEVVVVQSHGMARWLSLQFARRSGIAASLEMPFPGPWARELAGDLGIVGGAVEGDDPFDPTAMTWRLHEVFAGLGPDEVSDRLDPVRVYLRGDEEGLKRYQLAARVAGLFHQYQMHRPEMMVAWREGRDDDEGDARWQAELWRMLVAQGEGMPLSDILLELVRRLHVESPDPSALPARVTMFGVPTLAPAVIDVLGALSRHVECALYVVTPTPEYWTDLRSEAELERRRLREELDADEEHLEIAHPLLGSMGRLGREFLIQLHELDETGQAHEALESPSPDPARLLGRLQRDVRELRPPEEPDALVLRAEDRSLRVHVCHSPMRELEVMREEILRAFEEGVVREPGEVLLLVPDVAAYAPFVQAVFGRRTRTVDGGWLQLPFGLADRHPGDAQPFARLALALLAAAAGRRGLGEVFDLLEQEIVAHRFGLDPAELPALRERLREAGVRWGSDAAQRSRDAGVPRFEGATWADGLDRLMLGAMTGPVEALVGGILPLADATFGRSVRLAALREAVGRLFDHLDRLRDPMPLPEWVLRTRDAVLDLGEARDEDEQEQLRDLLEALESLERRARHGASTADASRAAFLEALEVELGEAAGDRGFISGGITVAELRPMRSLPFPLILVAGLEDQVFPRLDRPDGFDLMAQRRRPGDRRASDDDRYLFLETLLAAERQLVLSYVGRSQHDNRERGRSVCVDELLDVIDRCAVAEGGGPASRIALVEHPLQPTDARILDPDHAEIFTYDAGLAEAVRARSRGPEPLPAFVPESFAAPGPDGADDAPEDIRLSDLVDFWRNPSEWFCRRTLGLRVHFPEDEEEDRETFELGALDAWKAHEWLLARRAREAAPGAEEREILERSVSLPLGTAGRLLARSLQEESVARWRELHGSEPLLQPIEFALEGEGWILRGRLAPLRASGLSFLSPGKFRPRTRLGAWISHLAFVSLDAAEREGIEPVTLLATRDKSVRYVAPENPRAHLERFVRGYLEGRRAPLPFHAATSEAFALENDSEPGSPVEVFRRAKVQAAWNGNEHRKGDLGDDAASLLVRGLEDERIATEAFAGWAREVWLPLRACETKWTGEDA